MAGLGPILKNAAKRAKVNQSEPTKFERAGDPPKLESPEKKEALEGVLELGETADETVTPSAVPEQQMLPPGEEPEVIRPEEPVEPQPRVEREEPERTVIGPDGSEQPNWDYIETSEDIIELGKRLGSADKPGIDEARRGVVTHEEVLIFAQNTSNQAESVQKLLDGQQITVEEFKAVHEVSIASVREIRRLMDVVEAGEATDATRINLRRQLMLHREVNRAWMKERAESARKLNIIRNPTTGDGVDAKLMHDLANRTGPIEDIVADLRRAENMAEFNKVVDEYSRPSANMVAHEFWTHGILSGIRTLMVNLGGNLAFKNVDRLETAMAARIGKLLPGEDHVEVGEALADWYGAQAGIITAIKFFAKAFRTGESLDNLSKVDTANHGYRAINSRNWKATDEMRKAGGLQAILPNMIDILGSVVRLNVERGMVPTDEFSKTLLSRGKLHALALREAMRQQRLQGLDQQQFERMLFDLLESPPEHIQKGARDQALKMTLQSPTGEVGDWLQAFARSGVFKWFMPFARTVSNIVRANAERIPGLNYAAFPEVRHAMKHGGPERDMVVARSITGAAAMTVTAMLVGDGKVTGGGPDDLNRKKLLMATDWRPYSILVDGEYHSYLRADPLSMTIGVTANLVESFHEHQIDEQWNPDKDEEAMRAAGFAADAFADNIMDKSGLQGMSDFFGMFGRSAADDALLRAGTNFLADMVPLNRMSEQLLEQADPKLKQAWSLSEKIKKRIPGLRDSVPNQRDLFGEVIEKDEGWVGTMTLFPSSKVKDDPLLDHMAELSEAARRSPISMPRKDIDGMGLTSREYSEFVRYARRDLEIGGKTFKEALDDEINSRAYDREDIDGKVDALRMIQSEYDRVARQTFGEIDMDYGDRKEWYDMNEEMVSEEKNLELP